MSGASGRLRSGRRARRRPPRLRFAAPGWEVGRSSRRRTPARCLRQSRRTWPPPRTGTMCADQARICAERGIHFGAVTPPNMGQRSTFDPESSLLRESTTLTPAERACRPTAAPKWIPPCADMGALIPSRRLSVVRLAVVVGSCARRAVLRERRQRSLLPELERATRVERWSPH